MASIRQQESGEMMEPYVWWAVAGIGLIIVEMMSCTLILLVLGLAAFAGAAHAPSARQKKPTGSPAAAVSKVIADRLGSTIGPQRAGLLL